MACHPFFSKSCDMLQCQTSCQRLCLKRRIEACRSQLRCLTFTSIDAGTLATESSRHLSLQDDVGRCVGHLGLWKVAHFERFRRPRMHSHTPTHTLAGHVSEASDAFKVSTRKAVPVKVARAFTVSRVGAAVATVAASFAALAVLAFFLRSHIDGRPTAEWEGKSFICCLQPKCFFLRLGGSVESTGICSGGREIS